MNRQEQILRESLKVDNAVGFGKFFWNKYKKLLIECMDKYAKEYYKKQLPRIDLSTCEEGDLLISSQGAKLTYIAPTPYGGMTYLDHVVKYIEDVNGKKFTGECLGTRTNDGFAFSHNRLPTDHDIVAVIKQ